ncbi:ankyrin repeat domain-containing protein 50-like [Gigantopelta aegis]|uniref:ankyrin repeat domain-containing protein 50-like n=1 Tax=Gigantopelta aegis TaxID=1735272 RepID=UPI001B88D20B|nr:ankyrin repeat domain-containing protein 50-like [Gigantopelta aegis]
MAESEGTRRSRNDNSKAGFEKREKRRGIRKLQDAIIEKNVTLVKEILESDFDVDFQYRGQTALQLAVREGNLEICRLLIERGADVNMRDAEMNSLLNSACWRGHADIAKLLIENQADIDDRNDNGATALHVCAFKGHSDMCRMLLNADCDLDLLNRRGQTALYTATEQGYEDIMRMLIKAGCDGNSGDLHDNKTPLIVAAQLGNGSLVQVLLDGGCKTDCRDRLGQNALYHAACDGHLDVVRRLVAAGADLNATTNKGFTPLLDSIRNNHIEVAGELISSGCDVNKADRYKQAPLHAAIRQVSHYFDKDNKPTVSLVRKLVSMGCDRNIADGQGWTPLYQSAYAGDLEITTMLLKEGASLDSITKTGETILHGGVCGNSPEVVEFLLKSGCSHSAVNNGGQHALTAAIVSRSKIEIIKMLIDAGSDVNLKDTSSNTLAPLHEAVQHRYKEAAILLIDSGCNINILTSQNETPLYLACAKGTSEIVAHLIQQPNVDLRGAKPSKVAIHAASSNGHVQIVRMLINARCNLNQLNDGGLTPLQTAIQEDQYPVAKELLKHGCDINAHAKITRLMKCCLLQEDSHPHFGLEPLFLALIHKNIDLMMLLFQCYTHVPYETVKLLDTILRQEQQLNFHYSPQLKKKIFDMFNHFISTPKTLLDLCRGSLRDVLGSRPHAKVKCLPLANKLQDYVLMTETFMTLEEKERFENGEHLDENGFGLQVPNEGQMFALG